MTRCAAERGLIHVGGCCSQTRTNSSEPLHRTFSSWWGKNLGNHNNALEKRKSQLFVHTQVIFSFRREPLIIRATETFVPFVT